MIPFFKMIVNSPEKIHFSLPCDISVLFSKFAAGRRYCRLVAPRLQKNLR
jgi:hypothetical protein